MRALRLAASMCLSAVGSIVSTPAADPAAPERFQERDLALAAPVVLFALLEQVCERPLRDQVAVPEQVIDPRRAGDQVLGAVMERGEQPPLPARRVRRSPLARSGSEISTGGSAPGAPSVMKMQMVSALRSRDTDRPPALDQGRRRSPRRSCEHAVDRPEPPSLDLPLARPTATQLHESEGRQRNAQCFPPSGTRGSGSPSCPSSPVRRAGIIAATAGPRRAVRAG